MQNAVTDEKCQRVFEALGLVAQLAVDDDGVRSLEACAQQSIAIVAAFAVDPADRKAELLDDVQGVLERQRHSAATDGFGGPFDVGEFVLARLLPYPHQEARELLSACARLHEQFRQGHLQQILRKEERGLERHGVDGALMSRGAEFLGRQSLCSI